MDITTTYLSVYYILLVNNRLKFINGLIRPDAKAHPMNGYSMNGVIINKPKIVYQ